MDRGRREIREIRLGGRGREALWIEKEPFQVAQVESRLCEANRINSSLTVQIGAIKT